MPGHLLQSDQQFRESKDLLDQYANLSPKVKVEYIDPDKIPKCPASGNRNLGTAVVQIGEKKEEAKGMTEEGVTGALIRDLKGNIRTVCFVSGSGEHQIENTERDGLSNLKELLSQGQLRSQNYSLLQTAEVPADCTTLVIAGPTRDYVQPEVDAIKKYVEGGGRALLMMDPPLKLGRSEIADNSAGELIQSWGVTLDKNLILDLNPIGQIAGWVRKSRWSATMDRNPSSRHERHGDRVSARALHRDQEHRQNQCGQAV